MNDAVTIVAGLPRSGTSMLMKMLEAGGLPALTDHVRTADVDNPKGYYEFEQVKQIEHDTSWLESAQGHAVKMVSALLRHLPADYIYRIIFIRRAMPEILASQRKMLVHRGEPTETVDDAVMAEMFKKHLRAVDEWMMTQDNVQVLYISYNDVLTNPAVQAARINVFLGGGLDEQAMVGVVDPDLYRNRQSSKAT